MLYVLLVVFAFVAFAFYVAWLAARLRRLFGRVDAARAALADQLKRRALAAQELASSPVIELASVSAEILTTARTALNSNSANSEQAENDLTRALYQVPLRVDNPLMGELLAANRRVAVARQMYNDAVRDTTALRQQRIPRLLRLVTHQAVPGYFDIDTEIDSALATSSPR